MTNIDVILDKVTRGIDLLPEEGIILLTQTDNGLVNTIR